MSSVAPSADASVGEMTTELADLQKLIDASPADVRVRLQPAFARVVESTNRRRKILQLVQESIGQLRLDMKYLVFDLEATRRERDVYQAELVELLGEDGLPPIDGRNEPE